MKRRDALLTIGATACGFAAAGSLSVGCSAPPPDGLTRIPLAELPEGVVLHVPHHEQTVEIRHEGGSFRAMSLLCTHMGCTVRWEPDLDAYRCPCHFGRYDADGRVLGGHPPAPLRRFRWRVEGNVLVILPDYEA